MNDWYDVSSPRKKKDGGTYWQRVGSAQQKGDNWHVYFDALPLPDADGRCMVGIFPRTKRGEEEAPF